MVLTLLSLGGAAEGLPRVRSSLLSPTAPGLSRIRGASNHRGGLDWASFLEQAMLVRGS